MYLLPGNVSKSITAKTAAKSVRARFILAVGFAIKFGQLRESIYGLFRDHKFMQIHWQKKKRRGSGYGKLKEVFF